MPNLDRGSEPARSRGNGVISRGLGRALDIVLLMIITALVGVLVFGDAILSRILRHELAKHGKGQVTLDLQFSRSTSWTSNPASKESPKL